MPYIPQEKRDNYDDLVFDLVSLLEQEDENDAKGCLNYFLFSVYKHYVENQGKRYFRLQDFLGTLECCKLELYRRICSPYEDNAILKNGDVV